MQATARVVTVERQHGGRGHLTCCDTHGCRRCVPRGLWRPLLTGKGLPRLSSVVGTLSAHNIWLAARGVHTELEHERCARDEGGSDSAPALVTRQGQVPEPRGAFSTRGLHPHFTPRSAPSAVAQCVRSGRMVRPRLAPISARPETAGVRELCSLPSPSSPFLSGVQCPAPSAAPGVPRCLLPTRRSGVTSPGAQPLSPRTGQDTLSQL